jgi:hypothetical protein
LAERVDFDQWLRDVWERPLHYDRAGNPISTGRWIDLHQDFGYRSVAETIVGGVWRVHTAWMGIDHSFGFGPPLIFETMTFELAESNGFMEASRYGPAMAYTYNEDVGEQWRYSTETEARQGHAVIVARARDRFLPELASKVAPWPTLSDRLASCR